MSVCFIYFTAHYTMEVHALEPMLFYLFSISQHVLLFYPKGPHIQVIPLILVLVLCIVMF